MFQADYGADFQAKALSHFGRAELVRQQHLERDGSRWFSLLCPIDYSHATSSDLLEDYVVWNIQKPCRRAIASTDRPFLGGALC